MSRPWRVSRGAPAVVTVTRADGTVERCSQRELEPRASERNIAHLLKMRSALGLTGEGLDAITRRQARAELRRLERLAAKRRIS